MNPFKWWRKRKLLKARENYARWKAIREFHEKLGDFHCIACAGEVSDAIGKEAIYAERVEELMRNG